MGEISSRPCTGFRTQQCMHSYNRMKPTNVEDLYLLVGIAPPDLGRDVCARVEKKKQKTSVSHSLYGQNPTESRLKSRRCFLSSVRPADFHPMVFTESLARGHTSQWKTWRCLNRLRTGVTCSKEQRRKCGHYEGDTICDCGVSSENTRHMLEYPFLAYSCSLDVLLQFIETVCRTMEDSGLMTR